MAIKYDGGVILGADARSANVSFKDISKGRLTKFSINEDH
jgi:hypothetical protein